MPDEQKEIVRYEFQADIGDLEAKARRASALATGVDRAGRFTTPLMRDQGAEAAQGAADQAAFLAWRRKAAEEEEQLKKTGSATEVLIGHKRGLVNVIGLLGGSFSGLAAHLIGVVALMASAGAALAGWIAAAAGLTVVIRVVQELSAELKRANEHLKEFDAGRRKLTEGQQGPAEEIQRSLLKMGALGPGVPGKVFEYALGLQGEGLPADMALRIAPQAFVAGVDKRTAALLAIAAQATVTIPAHREHGKEVPAETKPGAFPETPEELRQALARATPEQLAQAAQQLAALRASPLGQESATFAAMQEKLLGEEPGRVKGIFEPDADALILRFGKLYFPDVVPEKAGPEAVEKWRQKYQALIAKQHSLRGQAAIAREVGASPLLGAGAFQAESKAEMELRVLEKQIELLDRVNQATTIAAPLTPVTEGIQAPVEAGSTTIWNVGTIYNDRDGPARQREQRSHFNLDTVDIKARR